jgi:hypothetical protein
VSGSLLAKLLIVNVLLVAFNVIPAFPMDGGRVLRALLATQMRYVTATQLAARVGQFIAVLFFLLSLTSWGGPMLAFIAVFVFLGAQQELAYARFREVAEGWQVRQAMVTRFQTLPVTLKVAEIPGHLAASTQKLFPFVDERLQLHGFARREELERATRELPPQAAANSVARRVPAVYPDTRFEDALALMQSSSEPLLPVVNVSGQIVGLVGLGNLAELSASRRPAASS